MATSVTERLDGFQQAHRWAGFPIAVIYNLPGVDDLNLKPETIAAIFDGQITKWNDDAIAADNSVLKATVTYSPSMASSAISLARLIGQGKGMNDLVELQVPKEITLASETITKENAGQYAKLGF